MTTLAADAVRVYELGDNNDLPVIAADIIYQGAAVGDNGSGYCRPLVAGDPFRGFATGTVDNSAGAAGAELVNLRSRGRIQLSISGLAITDVGKAVYASDDNTFTLTATSNSHIGRVVRFVSTGVGIVEFDATKGSLGSGTVLTLTALAGTANGTLQALPDPTDSPATADALRDDIVANLLPPLRNNLADIATALNTLLAQHN